MKFCQKCVTPDTNPFVDIDASGICSGCRSYGYRQDINWPERKAKFDEVVAYAKANSKGYDCLIPVSGGKDSYWQVITCLEYGLTPLAVTWRDPMRLEIGQRNLDKLREIGVDHIDYSINPKVEKKFLYLSYERYGVPGLPKHMALYNLPLRVAVQFDIPLMVWGENAAIEYGELEDQSKGFEVDYDWLMGNRGVTQGTTAHDWVGDDFTLGDMAGYFSPSREALESSGLRAVYLGWYFPWDQVSNFETARKYGFEAPESGSGYYAFDDVDSGFIAIHHYLKWYKFGYTRMFDNLSHDIRCGNITREAALQIIRERVPEVPHDDIRSFCDYLEIPVSRFYEIAEKFRNPEIWKQHNGQWMIENFIIPDWDGWESCEPARAAG